MRCMGTSNVGQIMLRDGYAFSRRTVGTLQEVIVTYPGKEKREKDGIK